MKTSRTSQRFRWLVGLVIVASTLGVLIGWPASDALPDDQDLAWVEPVSGEDDPFRKFAENPPEELLQWFRKLYLDKEWLTGIADVSFCDHIAEIAPGLREQIDSWVTQFDEDLRNAGGDPRLLSADPEIDGLDRRADSSPHPTPYRFGLRLRLAANIEMSCGDVRQVFHYLGVGLRIEDWQARFHPEANLAALEELNKSVRWLIEWGWLGAVTELSALDPIMSWSPSPELLESQTRRFYRQFKRRLQQQQENPETQLNEGRTLRQFIRTVRRQLRTGKPNQFRTRPIHRWLYPRSSEFLREEAFSLEWEIYDFDALRRKAICNQIAIACHFYERKHERLPDQLQDLVPEFLSSLPEASLCPTLHREKRKLQSTPTPEFFFGGEVEVHLPRPGDPPQHPLERFRDD